MIASASAVLDFWFDADMQRQWFNATPALDATIRERFEATWAAATAGELYHWLGSADGALALAIVLDQLPLNMYRGAARSFSSEHQAIAVSLAAIARGHDHALAGERLAFLYMPLMHSENPAHQERSVALFEAAGLADNARFARHHRELIRRFGRFPHRNAILGRDSTAEERDYLASKQAFTG